MHTLIIQPRKRGQIKLWSSTFGWCFLHFIKLDFFQIEVDPWKLAWLAGKIPMFNRKYIFIHGESSIVMLVFGGVTFWKDSQNKKKHAWSQRPTLTSVWQCHFSLGFLCCTCCNYLDLFKMLGKTSQNSFPNGGLMVMNPMGSQSVKNHQTNKSNK